MKPFIGVAFKGDGTTHGQPKQGMYDECVEWGAKLLGDNKNIVKVSVCELKAQIEYQVQPIMVRRIGEPELPL